MLVPAGIVVHDPVVLADTLMMPRRTSPGALDELGAPTEAADLTGPTPGLAVELRCKRSDRRAGPDDGAPRGSAVHLTALVVSPTRPGAVVKASAAAGYPTG